MKKLLLTLAMVLAAQGLFAQGLATYTRTTLTNAIAAQDTLVVVGSNTNAAPAANTQISVGGVSNLTKQLGLIDQEIVEFQSTQGTTFVTVSRGMLGTQAAPHAASAAVWIGQPSWFRVRDMQGSCTDTQEQVLPVFSVNRASKQVRLYNCIGGIWIPQILPAEIQQGALEKACSVAQSAVVLTSIGSSQTAQANKEHVVEFWVPTTMWVTGLTVMTGTTPDNTTNRTYVLRTIAGQLIAKSASTAASASGSAFQAIAFTAPVLVSGPAKYFLGVAVDSADANGIQTLDSSNMNTNAAAGVVSETYSSGISAKLTMPTTFTTATGPVGCLY